MLGGVQPSGTKPVGHVYVASAASAVGLVVVVIVDTQRSPERLHVVVTLPTVVGSGQTGAVSADAAGATNMMDAATKATAPAPAAQYLVNAPFVQRDVCALPLIVISPSPFVPR